MYICSVIVHPQAYKAMATYYIVTYINTKLKFRKYSNNVIKKG